MIHPLLRLRLEPLDRRRRRLRSGLALIAVWAATFATGLVVVELARRAGLAPALPLAGALAAGIAGGILVWRRQNRGNPDWRRLARWIEARQPSLDGRLLTAVQIRPAPGHETTHLQDRVVSEALALSRTLSLRRFCPGWLVGLVQLTQLGLLGLLLFGFWHLVSLPPAARATQISLFADDIRVTPGSVSLERGSSLVVLARFRSPVPPAAELVLTLPGQPDRRQPLARSLADPVFGGTVADVTSNFVYRVEAGDRRSEDFQVAVFEFPRLEQADATLTYPGYTRQPARHIANSRRLSAVEGSRLDLALQFNKPVVSAKLLPRGTNGAAVALTVAVGQPRAALTNFTLEASRNFDLQLVDVEGRTNKAPAQFVFEVARNRTPELKVTAPRGDTRPSALEELTFEGTAWDDFGVEAYGLAVARAGAEPQYLELGRAVPAKESRAFRHVVRLEDLGAQPDDLFAWFMWADDLGPDGQVRRTTGDLFFAEVRPFEEIFREGQGMSASAEAQQAESGEASQRSPAAKLVELQKQIISATWKLQRERAHAPPPPAKSTSPTPVREPTGGLIQPPGAFQQPGLFAQPATDPRPAERAPRARTAPAAAATNSPAAPALADEDVVRDAQGQALEQAETARENLEDPRTSALWEAAIRQMRRALERLEETRDSPAAYAEALAAEQAAYQALLKLQEHEISVSRSRQRGRQGSQSGREQQMQRQLDQLDLTQSENRYESESQARAPQSAERREQLQVLNRLQELARRQQDLNERLKELQTALTEARTEAEREAARRELKRLREAERELTGDLDELQQRMDRPENQSRMAEQRRQLEQTRNDLQRAAEAAGEGQASQALAAGTRAQRQMQQMRDDLRRETASEFEQDLRQMRTDARELSRNQEAIRRQVDELSAPGRRELDDSEARQRLFQGLADQRGRLTNLLDRATTISEQTESAEPLVSRGLYDTLRQYSQDDAATLKRFQEDLLNRGMLTRSLYDRLKENADASGAKALDLTADLLRQGYLPQADQAEERARAGVENLRRGIEKAAERVLGDDSGALRLARDELDALGAELERELAQAGAGGTNAAPATGSGTQAVGNSAPPGTPQGERRPDAGANGNDSTQPPGEPQPATNPQLADARANGGSQPDSQSARERGQPPGDGQRPGERQRGDGARQGSRGSTSTPGGERFPLDFSPGPEGRGSWAGGPITGGDFAPWSDRLREVEELVDLPSLRSEIATARERARQLRQDFRRDQKKPDWATVRLKVLQPLVEVRREISEELARREPRDQLVPVDRDPVPTRYTELVRRYYEDLGGRPPPDSKGPPPAHNPAQPR